VFAAAAPAAPASAAPAATAAGYRCHEETVLPVARGSPRPARPRDGLNKCTGGDHYSQFYATTPDDCKARCLVDDGHSTVNKYTMVTWTSANKCFLVGKPVNAMNFYAVPNNPYWQWTWVVLDTWWQDPQCLWGNCLGTNSVWSPHGLFAWNQQSCPGGFQVLPGPSG
jgi:hypothetical protein